MTTRHQRHPLACVLGDVDLVTALGLAGVPSVPVVPTGDPARFSRFTVDALEPLDHWCESEAFVERLVQWATSQPVPPILFYQTDGDLLLVSRYREQLGRAFRFAVPDAATVEDLVDKARFQRLAERLRLDVPRGRYLDAAGGPEPAFALSFPVIVKPVTRQGLARIEPDAKAIQVTSPLELETVWSKISPAGVDVIVQELVSGPEHRIESYHSYIDDQGHIAAEFTGKKLRTFPSRFGHTTALQLTDSPDVVAHGRSVVTRLGLRGVVKVDYKRDPLGNLRLLEVNPRFNLWHHPAAVAGINLPALVYADLAGEERPPLRPRTKNTTWCRPVEDHKAARAEGVSMIRWIIWATTSDTRSGANWDDPMPFLRGVLWKKARQRASTPFASRRRANAGEQGRR